MASKRGKWRDAALTGIDAQRAMLDELMGLNRNNDKPDAIVTDFRDERVCKWYLCGCCPHEVFSKTKNDLGTCDNVHDDDLKAQYEAKKKEGRDFGYENALETELQRFILEIDRKISKGQKRLEGEGGAAVKEPGVTKVDVDNNPEVLKIQAEIQEFVEKAEKAGEEGDVDLAQEMMEKIEELKQKKAELQGKIMADAIASGLAADSGVDDAALRAGGRGLDVNQKLRVCEVCGAFLSIYDSDRRLADHFGGKLHLGYLQIRDKLKEIREARQARTSGGGEKKKEGSPQSSRRASSRSRSRERSRRDRSRDRDRYGSRRRDRSRSRSRDRDSRRRSRSRSRSRSPRRDRRRSRSRGR